MSKSLNSCVSILNEGIRVFENEFNAEDTDTKKLILKNASVNFGIIAGTLDHFTSLEPSVVDLFTKYSSLLESAWEQF